MLHLAVAALEGPPLIAIVSKLTGAVDTVAVVNAGTGSACVPGKGPAGALRQEVMGIRRISRQLKTAVDHQIGVDGARLGRGGQRQRLDSVIPRLRHAGIAGVVRMIVTVGK